MTKLENMGKEQIIQALHNIGIEDEFINDIENNKTGIIYPEDDDCELGNNADEIPNYPDDDYDDPLNLLYKK